MAAATVKGPFASDEGRLVRGLSAPNKRKRSETVTTEISLLVYVPKSIYETSDGFVVEPSPSAKKVRENLIMIIRKIAEITSLYMFFVGFSLPLSCPPAPVVTDVISSFEVTGNSLHTKPRLALWQT